MICLSESEKQILWMIYDSTDRVVGCMYKDADGEGFILEDLEGNRFRVSKDTTLRQAVRILLSKQQIIG